MSIEGCGGTAHTHLLMFLTLALDREKRFASWPSRFTLSMDWMGGRVGMTLEVVWMIWRQEKPFPWQKLIHDFMVIQPTALPSCKASSCPTSTEVSQITQRINFGFSGTQSQILSIRNITPYARWCWSFPLTLDLPTTIIHSAVNTMYSSIYFLWPTK